MESGRFISVPHVILESAEYARLSAQAVKLLLDLCAQYNGINNGDFSAAWSVMEKKGWRSRDTLGNAQRELEESGFILKTRQGGRRKCNLYGVTWKNIDQCGGKLDVKSTKTPANTWKKAQIINTPSVSQCPVQRVNGAIP